MVQLRRPSPGAITSPFGQRVGSFHEGIDFGWGNGWNICAAAAGTVRHSGPGGIYGARYGNLTVIDHGPGVQTRYAHQSRMHVRPGIELPMGELIGVQGGSGAKGPNTYDPHLHFELLINGVRVDPMPYFSGTASDTPIIIEPDKEEDTMKIINAADGSGSYLVTDNGVVGILALTQANIWRLQQAEPGEWVTMHPSEIQDIDKALRSIARGNAASVSVDPAALATALAPLLKVGATVDDIEAALKDDFAAVVAAIPTKINATLN